MYNQSTVKILNISQASFSNLPRKGSQSKAINFARKADPLVFIVGCPFFAKLINMNQFSSDKKMSCIKNTYGFWKRYIQ